MIKISESDIEHLATLSGLSLGKDETKLLSQDVANIIKYIDKLGELDTEGVEPTYQVTGLTNVWREDKIVASQVSRDQLLELAPASSQGQVKVPKVL